MFAYFTAIGAYDYSDAYNYLSSYDKRFITRESFVEWRQAVERLYPMREFKISGGLPIITMTWGDGKPRTACRFRVAVTEEDLAENSIHMGDVEKYVINEYGAWRVFLGYSGVGELTRTFDERFEETWKRDAEKRWEEYYTGLYPEYNMLGIAGLRKAAKLEMYRQRRYGGAMTFTAISIKAGGSRGAGQEQLLRSAAKTIRGALRETDVPAYLGDGVFAILFVELRKKNAAPVIDRLLEKIRRNAGSQLGGNANIGYAFDSWTRNNCANLEGMNKIIKLFRKKM